MPFVYTDSLATAGNLTTNGTANTETEAFFLKPGATRSLYLAKLDFGGKAAAVTQLSAAELRVIKWGTASTGGTGLASVATDGSAPATTITSGSAPTSGTTRTNAGCIIQCGASAPSPGWNSGGNVDVMISLAAGNAGSISAMSVGAAVSMPYEFSAQHYEF